MAVVIDQMNVQVAEQPPARSAPAAAAVPPAPDPNMLMRLLQLAAERRVRLAAD
jgi:hypothetical protein